MMLLSVTMTLLTMEGTDTLISCYTSCGHLEISFMFITTSELWLLLNQMPDGII